jgi:hypothetical protein
MQLLTAGRPIPKPKENKQEDGLIEYDELCRLIEERNAAAEGGRR